MLHSIIVAVSENNVIGNENKLLWNLPADLKHFKETTSGYSIIMGRKTFESIGKPLPNRKNIIISRNKNFKAEGCIIVDSLKEAMFNGIDKNAEMFIIGGGEIYKQSINIVSKIYLTKVHHNFDGDTFFPIIDESIWKKSEEKYFDANEKNKYSYSFITYIKKPNNSF